MWPGSGLGNFVSLQSAGFPFALLCSGAALQVEWGRRGSWGRSLLVCFSLLLLGRGAQAWGRPGSGLARAAPGTAPAPPPPSKVSLPPSSPGGGSSRTENLLVAQRTCWLHGAAGSELGLPSGTCCSRKPVRSLFVQPSGTACAGAPAPQPGGGPG